MYFKVVGHIIEENIIVFQDKVLVNENLNFIKENVINSINFIDVFVEKKVIFDVLNNYVINHLKKLKDKSIKKEKNLKSSSASS